MRLLLCILSLTLSAALIAPTTSVAAQRSVANDINGDGAGDLLVGVPLEGVAGQSRAGSVNVIYSNGRRLAREGNTSVSQRDLAAQVEEDDLFGSAVELADINGDGYADAIVGSTGESLGLQSNVGSFTIVPGSSTGLNTPGATRYRQGGELPGTPATDDFFGFTIASGDFDGDGFDDIAVSAPFDDVSGRVDAGGIIVAHGSAGGLDTARSVFFSQAGEVAGRLEAGDFFGWSLATGDFNGDGRDDLAVGAPGEDRNDKENVGAVNILYGSDDGITATGDQAFTQAGSVRNTPEREDLFGFAVAASDMNCDGYDDLLVGVPNEVLGSDGVVAGFVNVLHGSPAGVKRRGNVRLAQGTGGVAGTRDFNQFGAALAAGDFDGDGCGDIAISAHTTDIGGSGPTLCVQDPDCSSEAGAVVVVYGSEVWPTLERSNNFSQRGPIDGQPQDGDFFGRTLAVIDANGDGRDELVIGTPREDFGAKTDAGKVTVLRGTRSGLTVNGDYSFSQAGPIAGRREAGDQFGSSLADASF